MSATVNPEQIAGFWQLFRQRAEALAAAKSADEPVYEELLARLQQVHPGLFLEFCAEPGALELIVTAEGNRALFGLARAVVAQAPKIPGWTITALKPRLGVPATVTWRSLTLDTEDILVEPLRHEDGGWRLRVLVRGLREDQRDDAHHAVLRALDHVLGEEPFAETVAAVEVLALPAEEDARGLLALEELDAYLSSR